MVSSSQRGDFQAFAHDAETTYIITQKRRQNDMKKTAVILCALILACSLTGMVFAEKTKPVADVNAAVDETAQEPLTELESEDPSDGSEDESMDVQYVMFVGTNDKDTNVPVCGREEAMTKVKQILIDHFGGYTVSDALGGWIGDDGMRYEEYTLMIFLSDTTLDEVHAAADELRELFDQSSILIQTYQTKTEFYSGE